MKVCPTCGQPIAPAILVRGPRRQAIFDYIKKHPEGVTREQILSAVYADDPNGGPNSRGLPIMIRQLNERLIPHGLTVEATGGPGSVYILKTLEKRVRPLAAFKPRKPHPRTKIKPADMPRIRALYARGMTQSQIGKQYGVSGTGIQKRLARQL